MLWLPSLSESAKVKIKITCSNVVSEELPLLGKTPTCTSENSLNSLVANTFIESVVDLKNEKIINIERIKGLKIEESNVKYFPSGIKSQFSQLKALLII